MYPIKIDFKAKCNANKRGFCVKKPRFVIAMAVVLSFVCVQSIPAQKILIETGFEDHVQPNAESPFQPSTKNAKNGEKSLEIFAQAERRLYLSGYRLETDASIVSTEFYVYIEKGEQSFAVTMHAGEKQFGHQQDQRGGPYVEWYDGDVRYHVHRGKPWREISKYPINGWHYVRIVANFKENSFDFYIGNRRETALASRPKRDLEFQDPATSPRPKWFLIFAWAMEARGYMDDLLIYEGDAPISLAVEPTAKLATLWGKLKRE